MVVVVDMDRIRMYCNVLHRNIKNACGQDWLGWPIDVTHVTICVMARLHPWLLPRQAVKS